MSAPIRPTAPTLLSPPSARTRVRRMRKRAHYERGVIDAILDDALICHVGFSDAEAGLCVLPTAIVRIGNHVYVHGSRVSRMARVLASGAPVCIAVTLLDGIVAARSGFHSSMNYRAAVLFGSAALVAGDDKAAALDAFIDKLIPGRRADLRAPKAKELRATAVLRMPIDEASAKVRSGPPLDDEDDYAAPVWAGVIPLRLAAGAPLPCPRLPAGVAVPAYARCYRQQ